MLGHLSLYSSAEEINDAIGTRPPVAYEPSYNISPGRRCVVVWRLDEHSGPSCDWMRWGLKSRWTGSESLHSFVPGNNPDRNFPEVFNHCRCLVAVNGFFLFAPPSPEEAHGRVQVYYFRLKHESIMCLAGIREDHDAIEREDPEFFERYLTFAIMDTYSSDAWMSVQPRIPVILHKDQCFRWMWDDLSEAEVQEICRPLDVDQLEVYEVSSRVMDEKENDAALLEAIGADGV